MAEGVSEREAPAGNQVVYRPEALAAHRRAREFSRTAQFKSPRTLVLLWLASLASLAFGVVLALSILARVQRG